MATRAEKGSAHEVLEELARFWLQCFHRELRGPVKFREELGVPGSLECFVLFSFVFFCFMFCFAFELEKWS